MLLRELLGWAPFRIDALGLVTIFGAEEVNMNVGRLSRSPWTDFLPLLGSYTIAGNNITKPIPGFTAYNITDGIVTSDVPGWFSRWLLAQDLSWNTTSLKVEYQKRRIRLSDTICTYGVGASCLAIVLALALGIGDWWGVANAASMIISSIVRKFIVEQNRRAVDLAAEKAQWIKDDVVTFWNLPTGHAIAIRCSRAILLKCLLTTPKPPCSTLYGVARVIGWIGFGCHAIALGMTCLFNQIISVIVLVGATVIVVNRWGDDETSIGTTLRIEKTAVSGGDFRATAYANLDLTEQQEEYMMNWNLFPQKGNGKWWQKYRECQGRGVDSFNRWDTKVADST
ncbi:MAG: hypothetical protein Q9160_004999 [Pyrenula sp. 1 TL-2023]